MRGQAKRWPEERKKDDNTNKKEQLREGICPALLSSKYQPVSVDHFVFFLGLSESDLPVRACGLLHSTRGSEKDTLSF